MTKHLQHSHLSMTYWRTNMNEWTDGSLINGDAIDKMTEAQLDWLADILKDVK